MARSFVEEFPKLNQKATFSSALPIKFTVGRSGFSSDTLMTILSGTGVTTFFPCSRRDNTLVERVIPLPEEIPQGQTEFEEVVYCQSAKLCHLSNGKWKERGISDIQILRQSSTTGTTFRFLMWNKRDMNTICLNHALTSDLSFQPRGKKGWLWSAQNFSGGKGKTETFVIRFKYHSYAKAFMATVLKNQNSLTGTDDYESEVKKEKSMMDKEEDVLEDDIDEDIFFIHRAKLYRFMPKEYDWKRKGFDDVGFLKKGKRLRIRPTRDDRYRTRLDEEEAF